MSSSLGINFDRVSFFLSESSSSSSHLTLLITCVTLESANLIGVFKPVFPKLIGSNVTLTFGKVPGSGDISIVAVSVFSSASNTWSLSLISLNLLFLFLLDLTTGVTGVSGLSFTTSALDFSVSPLLL